MPEIEIDKVAVSRFISSLSKSLQALCHGCMDFDSGIEVVGFLNINIDCGNKVDCVLNEKVMKSNDNSMTFVSNSFLAEKAKLTVTRDESCSPIKELNQPMPIFSPSKYNDNFAKAPFSDERQMSVKRPIPVGRQWKGSGKRTKTMQQIDPPLTQEKTPQNVNSEETSYSSSLMDLKREVPDVQTNIFENQSELSSGDVSFSNIKPDPDAPVNIKDEANDSNPAKENSDLNFSKSFLHSDQNLDTDNLSSKEQNERSVEAETDNNVSMENNFQAQVSEGNNFQSSSFSQDFDQSNSNFQQDQPSTSHSFDDYEDDTLYSQSNYSENPNQLEVIEIDDEDEDVQAMFTDQQKQMTWMPYKHEEQVVLWSRQQSGSHTNNILTNTSPEVFSCGICEKHFQHAKALNSHINSVHPRKHFHCSLCDKYYKRRYHLKRHFTTAHNMLICLTCYRTFELTEFKEYNFHTCQSEENPQS